MRIPIYSLLFASIFAGCLSSANAGPLCTDFTGVNGTSAYPGTFVGTVGSAAGQVCQIGNLSGNNLSGTGTYVNNSQPNSIYSFYWGEAD